MVTSFAPSFFPAPPTVVLESRLNPWDRTRGPRVDLRQSVETLGGLYRGEGSTAGGRGGSRTSGARTTAVPLEGIARMPLSRGPFPSGGGRRHGYTFLTSAAGVGRASSSAGRERARRRRVGSLPAVRVAPAAAVRCTQFMGGARRLGRRATRIAWETKFVGPLRGLGRIGRTRRAAPRQDWMLGTGTFAGPLRITRTASGSGAA